MSATISGQTQFQLTIITICLNCASDIAVTCESVINQTWQEFEWVVIDGGSTDGTVEILSKYSGRIDVLVSEKDRNTSDAINKALKLARGEYVLLLTGGDRLASSSALEEGFARVSHDADIIYGDIMVMKDNQVCDASISPPESEVDALFFVHDIISMLSSFIKRELYEKYGGFNESYVVANDLERMIVFSRNGCTFKKVDCMIAAFALGGISDKKSPLFLLHMAERKALHTTYYSEEEIAEATRRYMLRRKYSVVRSFPCLPWKFRVFSVWEAMNGTKRRYSFFGVTLLKVRYKSKYASVGRNTYYLLGCMKIPQIF